MEHPVEAPTRGQLEGPMEGPWEGPRQAPPVLRLHGCDIHMEGPMKGMAGPYGGTHVLV